MQISMETLGPHADRLTEVPAGSNAEHPPGGVQAGKMVGEVDFTAGGGCATCFAVREHSKAVETCRL